MGKSSDKYKEESSKRRPYEKHYVAPSDKHKHKKQQKAQIKENSTYYEENYRSSRSSYDTEKKLKYNYNNDDSDVVEIAASETLSKNSQSPPKLMEKIQDKYFTPRETPQNLDSLSIEETNKLRVKLGLGPLVVGSSKLITEGRSSSSKKKDDWGEFYHKPAENLLDKAYREKIKAKIANMKQKRKLDNKLSRIRTLGESDEEDDLMAWVDRNRKIEQAKKEAERKAKELEELDAQFGISDIFATEKNKEKYTEMDLRGLIVQHDLDSFADEKDVILTLKDKGVLDEDDDVLVNVNMLDDERYKKSLVNKKTKILYNAYEDNEFDEFGNFKEKTLLSKYDEEIHGEKRESFKIGYDNAADKRQTLMESIKSKLAKKRLESIAEKQFTTASEYYNDEELAKFKKPMKKIRNIRSKGKWMKTDELEPDNDVIEKLSSSRPKVKNEPDYDNDDVSCKYLKSFKRYGDLAVEIPKDENGDILVKALHKTRKINHELNLITDITKIETKIELEETMESGNIILNATTEFCRSLGDIQTYGKSGIREDIMDFQQNVPPEENSDGDCEIIETTSWNAVITNQAVDSTQIKSQYVQILDEEPDIINGVAGTLKLAISKGYLDKEQINRPSNSKFQHLQAQHYFIEDKSYRDEDESGLRRKRFAGPLRTFKEKNNFKPIVNLEYINDEGHVLNSKEAFRYLSHKFHGKGPGKNKVEKRFKRSEQEQLMKQMSSTDTPLGTLNMLQAKLKETKSPFIVLSGNKQGQSTPLSKTRR